MLSLEVGIFNRISLHLDMNRRNYVKLKPYPSTLCVTLEFGLELTTGCKFTLNVLEIPMTDFIVNVGGDTDVQ